MNKSGLSLGRLEDRVSHCTNCRGHVCLTARLRGYPGRRHTAVGGRRGSRPVKRGAFWFAAHSNWVVPKVFCCAEFCSDEKFSFIQQPVHSKDRFEYLFMQHFYICTQTKCQTSAHLHWLSTHSGRSVSFFLIWSTHLLLLCIFMDKQCVSATGQVLTQCVFWTSMFSTEVELDTLTVAQS